MMRVLKTNYSNIKLLEYDNIQNSVIGIYIQTGVLTETPQQEGITYLIDDYLYNELCDSFNDSIEIKSGTNYDYSEYIFMCKRLDVNKIIDTFENIINSFSINDYTYFKKLRNAAVKKSKSHKKTIKEIFDKQYYNSARLAQGVIGSPHAIKNLSMDQLNKRFQTYWRERARFICICNPEEPLEIRDGWFQNPPDIVEPIALSAHFCNRNINDIFCLGVDDKNVEIICALDCPEDTVKDPFVLETLCCIWEFELKADSFPNCVKMDKPRVYFDYGMPRILFEFYIGKEDIYKYLDSFLKLIKKQISLTIFPTAILETIENIRYCTNDMHLMNRTIAQEYFAGGHYDLLKYEHLEQEFQYIAYQQVLKVQTKIVKKSHFSLAYSGLEGELDNIRNVIKSILD